MNEHNLGKLRLSFLQSHRDLVYELTESIETKCRVFKTKKDLIDFKSQLNFLRESADNLLELATMENK